MLCPFEHHLLTVLHMSGSVMITGHKEMNQILSRHHWPEVSQPFSQKPTVGPRSLAFRHQALICNLTKQTGDLCCWHHLA